MTTFHEEMEAAARAGIPLLDNVSDGTPDGPGQCACPLIPGEHPENECVAPTWKAAR